MMRDEVVHVSSDFLHLLKTRRSIRIYLSKKISELLIHRVLEAATWAPSAHNAQPWRFIVITNQEMKQKLAEAMANEWAEDLARDNVSPEVRKNLVEASINRFVRPPILILACVTLEEMDEYVDERRRRFEHLMATQSLAAAIQNLLLAAHSEGLGSCWFCAPLFCQEVVRKVLGIPVDVEPQALITLGYPSEKPEPTPRKPLKEVVFKDRWGEVF